MGEGGWLVLLIALQRVAELIRDRRNTSYLLALGGIEHGRAHYPLLVALHAAWLAVLWALGRSAEADRLLLAVFLVLQAGRLWCLVSLGARWTTRIIVLPGGAAGAARALPFHESSQLRGRGGRNRGRAACARPAGLCRHFLACQCSAAGLAHPRGECRAGWGCVRCA
jgi:hypothetical protein